MGLFKKALRTGKKLARDPISLVSLAAGPIGLSTLAARQLQLAGTGGNPKPLYRSGRAATPGRYIIDEKYLARLPQFRPETREAWSKANPYPRVELTQGERDTISTAEGLISGNVGNFRSLLTGDNRTGLLARGVIDPARQEFEDKTLPMIDESYSAGAYGAGFYSGARGKARSDASGNLERTLAEARYKDYQTNNQLQLQAASQLSPLMGIISQDRMNEIENINRVSQEYYAQMGLDQNVWKADMERIKAATHFKPGTSGRGGGWVQPQTKQKSGGLLGAIMGGLSGAATGASMGGGWGAAIGGALGAGAGYLGYGQDVAAVGSMGQTIQGGLASYKLNHPKATSNPSEV